MDTETPRSVIDLCCGAPRFLTTPLPSERARTRRCGRPAEGFRALFATAPLGVALCHLDGSFADVNLAFTELIEGTGIDPDTGHLLDLLAFLPRQANERERWPNLIAEVANGARDVARMHVSLAPPDQAPRFVQATVAAVALNAHPYLLMHLEDGTGRRLDEQRLIHLATHDGLTGLPNRELINQALVQALARAAITTLPVAVLYLDLDRFKLTNDTYGHHAGDAVLTAVGQRLVGVLRAADTAGRLGGDEFLVIAGDVPDEQAAIELQRRLEEALAEPTEVEGVSIALRATFGAALSRSGESPTSLIRRADAAMYAAKRARRRQSARELTTMAQQQMVIEQAIVAEQL